MKIEGRKLSITENNITTLGDKADILVNFVTPNYEEVFETEVGIVSKTYGLLPLIQDGIEESRQIITTQRSYFGERYILHLVYSREGNKKVLNDKNSYKLFESAIYLTLKETLLLEGVTSIAIPFVGG